MNNNVLVILRNVITLLLTIINYYSTYSVCMHSALGGSTSIDIFITTK